VNHKDFVVKTNSDFLQLLKVMSRITPSGNSSGFAVVEDNDDKVIGVVTDSDIRRFVLINKLLPSSIEDVVNRNFVSISKQDYELNFENSAFEAIKVKGWKTKFPVKFLPVIDNNELKLIIDIEEFRNTFESQRDLIYVIGLGYVGLTLGLYLSSSGKNIIGIDVDRQKINLLNQRKSYIDEIGLQNLLSENLNKSFHAYSDYNVILQRERGVSGFFILCLPTPLDKKQQPNETFLVESVEALLPYINIGDSIILRSTIPIGFSKFIANLIEQKKEYKVGVDFYLIFAPERTVEGNALIELKELPQIIGGVTSECQKKGLQFFQQFMSNTVVVKKIEESELIKIASNSYRDYIFAFSNYLAIIAQKYDIDVNDLIQNANSGYSRNNFPKPSPGVGGPCLTKDSYFMPSLDSENQSPIFTARKFNESMPKFVTEFLFQKIGNDLIKYEIAIVGLAFKGSPETNDLRNSVSIEVSEILKEKKCYLTYYEASFENTEQPIQFPEISNPKIFLILNNHPKNVDFVLHGVAKTSHEDIYIFDPWRLITLNLLKNLNRRTKIKYLTLSNTYTIEILNA
jgi:nucleotide sugar dehydrogenase